jgi:hypothetical protein
MQDLKNQYENIVNQYITIFCEKQEIEKETTYWVGGCIGEVIDLNGAFISFDDIRRDIDTDQPKDKIFNWYWDNDYINNKNINYHSYIKGLRVKDQKIMEYYIVKGDKFLCLENYPMNNGTIGYTKGKVYESEIDNCITDDDKDKTHEMSNQYDFFEYFKLINRQLNND